MGKLRATSTDCPVPTGDPEGGLGSGTRCRLSWFGWHLPACAGHGRELSCTFICPSPVWVWSGGLWVPPQNLVMGLPKGSASAEGVVSFWEVTALLWLGWDHSSWERVGHAAPICETCLLPCAAGSAHGPSAPHTSIFKTVEELREDGNPTRMGRSAPVTLADRVVLQVALKPQPKLVPAPCRDPTMPATPSSLATPPLPRFCP